MHKVYCPSEDIQESSVSIDDIKTVHYLKNVLRIKINEELVIFDNKDKQLLCIVTNISAKKIEMAIKNRIPITTASYKLNIACAIPKNTRMEDIIDKLTQIGADRIIPFESRHVIVKLDAQKKKNRYKRWQAIALSAAQQSQRTSIPIIEEIIDIKKLIGNSEEYDLKLIPHLREPRISLKETLLSARNSNNILVLIGPEGDFSDEEVDIALKSGFIPVSLGDNVLRVETAAVVVAGAIKQIL